MPDDRLLRPALGERRLGAPVREGRDVPWAAWIREVVDANALRGARDHASVARQIGEVAVPDDVAAVAARRRNVRQHLEAWLRGAGRRGERQCRSEQDVQAHCDTNTGMGERMRRVNESVREVLAEALPELKDPRIGLVTVMGVETAPDLRHATVYVSVLGSERKREQALAGLQAAHGLLQARVARELRLKRTPQLAFEYDPSVERGVRMTRLIDELARDD